MNANVKSFNAVDELGFAYYSEYDDKLSRAKRKYVYQGTLGAEFTPCEDDVRLYGASSLKMWYEMGVTQAEFDRTGEIPF